WNADVEGMHIIAVKCRHARSCGEALKTDLYKEIEDKFRVVSLERRYPQRGVMGPEVLLDKCHVADRAGAPCADSRPLYLKRDVVSQHTVGVNNRERAALKFAIWQVE